MVVRTDSLYSRCAEEARIKSQEKEGGKLEWEEKGFSGFTDQEKRSGRAEVETEAGRHFLFGVQVLGLGYLVCRHGLPLLLEDLSIALP